MEIRKSFSRRAVLAGMLGVFAFAGLQAQTADQWVTITYYKVEPGKAAEYRKFLETNWSKLAQASVDDGRTVGSMALRLTQPYSSGAPFDYALVSIMAKRPSVAPANREEWDARAKKVGYPGIQEYLDSANALAKQVKSEWLTTGMRTGHVQTGNYMRTMRYAVDRENRREVMDFLREYTMPINSERMKDGRLQGFGVHIPAMVSPEEAGYAMSVSFIVKDADAAMEGPSALGEERFKKIFPGRSYAAYLNQLNAINSKRKPVTTRIFEVVSVVGALPAVQPSMP